MKATHTIIIALVAMIGMTGLAMGDSTDIFFSGDGDYDVNFEGVGSGELNIVTYTSGGQDVMNVAWDNTVTTGWQAMDNSVSRIVTVGDKANWHPQPHYNLADATITTITTTETLQDLTVGAVVQTVAHFEDEYAVGDHATLDQTVYMNGNSVIGSAEITGYAYNDNEQVLGRVIGGYGGESVSATLETEQGHIDMTSYYAAGDGYYDGAGMFISAAVTKVYMLDIDVAGTFTVTTAGAYGVADINTDELDFDWTSYNVPAVVTVSFIDPFTANGYIYAIEI